MSIDKFAGLAKGVVKLPNTFNLEGKRVNYDAFYSQHIALPAVGWLSQSMALSLFDEPIFPISVRADEASLSGLKISVIEGGEWTSKHLLVMTSAIEEFSYPAMKIKGYDYSDMLLKMRDKVLSLHKNGEPVQPDSLALSNHIYAEIAPKGLKFKPEPSLGRGNA
tara:strand:+ start:6277 stop:6771 length:495 start_codon:yes stop_codon:yes gene_type:complete